MNIVRCTCRAFLAAGLFWMLVMIMGLLLKTEVNPFVAGIICWFVSVLAIFGWKD